MVTLAEGGFERDRGPAPHRSSFVVLAFCITAAIAVWLVGIASPLAIDETGVYWNIAAGFGHIAARRGLSFPAYPYVVWLVTRLTGTSEIGMHLPSFLAMLGAAYLLYRCARHLFEREIALLATLLFCVNPTVIHQATNARPYAFVILATNAAILALLRMRKSNSLRRAALFGLLAALIVYFHFLGALILPAFLLCFILWKRHDGKVFWQQLGVAFAVFAVAFLPLVPDLLSLFRTAGAHVYQLPPGTFALFWVLFQVLVPGFVALALVAATLAAAATALPRPRLLCEPWQLSFCLVLALTPVLILEGISVATPLRMFDFRHAATAIPGVSLCWALCLSQVPRRSIRMVFSLALVALTAGYYFAPGNRIEHGITLKSGLAAIEKNAAPDHAPVLMPAAFIEYDSVTRPLHDINTSRYFAPLLFYKISVPVIPLPDRLNPEAKRTITSFLEQARRKHERFLAMDFMQPYTILDWIKQHASKSFSVHELGDYDGVKVIEFQPRQPAANP